MAIASKWKKHRALSGSKTTLKHLPAAWLYSDTSLWTSLQRFRCVYLKPVSSSGGNGIIRIDRKGTSSFLIRHGVVRSTVSSRKALFTKIRRLIGKRQYLIQQGIHLLKIQKRPLDYRILLLRPKKTWKIMGTMGKWAAPGKIVTNHCRGGKAVNLFPSLKASAGLSTARCQQIAHKLNRLGADVARVLSSRYRLRRLGIDVGIDKQLRIWILEVNTAPAYQLFRHHHNRSIYPRIVRYMKKIRK